MISYVLIKGQKIIDQLDDIYGPGKGMSKGQLTSVSQAADGIDKLINENSKEYLWYTYHHEKKTVL